MIFRAIALLLIVCVGCTSASKTAQMKAIGEDNKDVVVLSYLIRDYMRKTRNTDFTLADILKGDTLARIKNNFSGLEVTQISNIWIGGYAVYFKFADGRNKDLNNSLQMKPHERIPWKVTTKMEVGKSKAQLTKKYDGEIHFYYPERHYGITEIIVRSPSQ